ncbi:winged helix-turn-helix domain-containing protein [Niabella terrae]
MKFENRKNAGSFLYLQIKEGMLQAILKGEYKSGEKLPTSTARLGADVSSYTLNRAYRMLCREGFVVYFKKRGYFVA